MRHVIDEVLRDGTGLAVQGATVEVRVAATPAGTGALATIYSINVAAPGNVKANPLTTDAFGKYDFYVADGNYDIVQRYGAKVAIIDNQQFVDQLNVPSPAVTVGMMVLALFTAAPTKTIPIGVDLVRTNAYSGAGKGGAEYEADAAVDAAYVAAHPRSSFISFNGRGFRMVKQIVLDITQVGAACDAAADGSSGTDDSAAVNAAAGLLPNGGGICVPGQTLCASPLAVASRYNIRFFGLSGTGAGGGNPPPSQLIYTGGGAAPFIDAAHSNAIEFYQLGVRYTAGFTGNVIEFSNTTGGADAAYGLIERCFVGGVGNLKTARCCVSFEGAIICSVVDSNLQLADVAIRGVKEFGPGSVGYSNVISILRTTFANLGTAAIVNPGQTWVVQGNTFEGSCRRALWCDISAASGPIISALDWLGNWHGDSALVVDAWINFNHTSVRGGKISGNYLDTSMSPTTADPIRLPTGCYGLEISSNTASGGGGNGTIDLGGVDHFGLSVFANYLGKDIVGLSANSTDISIVDNKKDGGFAKSYERSSTTVDYYRNVASPRFEAPVATNLDFELRADLGQSRFLRFRLGATDRAIFGTDTAANGENVILATYNNLGGFVGYALTVDRASMAATFGGTVAASNLAGTNTGDQFTAIAQNTILGRTAAGAGPASALATLPTAAVPPFAGGDVTGAGGSLVLSIANGAVTYAKIQNVSATDRLLGRSTAGAGVVEEIVCSAAGRALIDDADAAAQRTTLGLAAIAASGSGADLGAATVTYAKIQNVAASRLLGNPTGGAAAPSEIGLGANLGFTGTNIQVQFAATARLLGRTTAGAGAAEEISVANGITLTAATLGLGAITPTSVAATGAITSSGATNGIGYATGAGGTQAQATSKATGVTLNKACGEITLNAAALAASTTVSFVLTNSAIAAGDMLLLLHVTTGTFGAYLLNAHGFAAGSCTIDVRNVSLASLSEAIVIRFAVIKAVTA